MGLTHNFSFQKILVIALFVVLAGVGGYLAFRGGYFSQGFSSKPSSTSTPSSADTPAPPLPEAVTASSSAPVIIKSFPLPSLSPLKAPTLTRVITIPASMGAEEVAIIKQEIAVAKEALRQNGENLSVWTNLGILYKALGDYEGAREVWTYVSLASGGDMVALNNLGNLYHYDLRDHKRSEESFLKAINSNPTYLLSYLNLHDLYRLSYEKETNKAADILLRGLERNPKAVDLTVALATYYRDRGDSAKARVFYEKAIALAESLGNQSLKNSLTSELQTLK